MFCNSNKVFMSNKPFIIKSGFVEPTVPKDHEAFDAEQETKIQILQAVNGYLTINMAIESCKIFWSFWHYTEECPSFSYLSLGFMIINVIWCLCSYFGFRSIRNKNPRHLRIFLYLTVFNFFLRIIMYIICGVIMKGKVPSYATVSPQELNNRICSALYPQTLYIITGIIEALISLLVIYLTKGIIAYLEKWQQSQTERLIPMTTFGKENNY